MAKCCAPRRRRSCRWRSATSCSEDAGGGEVTGMDDALVWQLVDSAFPTGAFAHSLGLESAWHHGEIASRDDLRRFVDATILQAASGALSLVNAAHGDPAR